MAATHQIRPEIADRAVAISDVEFWPRNPRDGDIPKIRESLRTYGQYKAILGRMHHNVIIAGNQTMHAARDEGWSHVAVDWIDVDDDTARRIMLIDNKTSDDAGYKDELLLAELRELDGLEGTGFSDKELDDLEKRVNQALDDEPTDSGAEDDYTSKYEIVVECRDENQQQDLYAKFQAEGLTCRVLSM